MHQPNTGSFTMTRGAIFLFAVVAFSVHAVDAQSYATCAAPTGRTFVNNIYVNVPITDADCGDGFAVNLTNLNKLCTNSVSCNLTVGSEDHSNCCTDESSCKYKNGYSSGTKNTTTSDCPSGMVPNFDAGVIKCEGSQCFPEQCPPLTAGIGFIVARTDDEVIKCEFLEKIKQTNQRRCCKVTTCSDPADVVGVTTVVVDNSIQNFAAHVSCAAGYYDRLNSLNNVSACTEPGGNWSFSGSCTPCSEYPLPPTPAGEAVTCSRCTGRTYTMQRGVKTTLPARCLDATCPSGTFNSYTNVCTSAATRVTAHMLLVLCVVLCYSS